MSRNLSVDRQSETIRSADGSRWAIGRNLKRSLGGHRWDAVRVWSLRTRDEAGKVIVINQYADEVAARAWVAPDAAPAVLLAPASAPADASEGKPAKIWVWALGRDKEGEAVSSKDVSSLLGSDGRALFAEPSLVPWWIAAQVEVSAEVVERHLTFAANLIEAVRAGREGIPAARRAAYHARVAATVQWALTSEAPGDVDIACEYIEELRQSGARVHVLDDGEVVGGDIKWREAVAGLDLARVDVIRDGVLVLSVSLIACGGQNDGVVDYVGLLDSELSRRLGED